MAKKAKKTENVTHVEGTEVNVTQVVEQPKVETPVMEKPLPKKKKDTWEIKDRTYFLKNRQRPLSKAIKACDIYYFDEEKGYERELKYCENQRTVFVRLFFLLV